MLRIAANMNFHVVDYAADNDEVIAVVHGSLFINKRFALNKMFQRNASKFAIFYV